jgi:hypothetical protein
MTTHCHVQEEQWIDWHLKRLPAETAEALERHAQHCETCRRMSSQWAVLLGADTVQLQQAMPPMPDERIRRSLRFSVRRRGWKVRMQRLRSRPVWQLSGLGAALLFGLLLFHQLLAGSGATPVEPAATQSDVLTPLDYAERHVPEGVKLMSLPDTRVFGTLPPQDTAMMDSEAAGSRTGDYAVKVWLNGRTGEVLVLLEGVLLMEDEDVQAWGMIREMQTNLGLLEFHDNQGHLYWQSLNLPEVEELALTIEPKGGSLLPTLPETARIRLVDLRDR